MAPAARWSSRSPRCCAVRALLFYFQAAAGKTLEPGVVAVIQTFGDRINFHPHLHFLVTEGGVDEAGIFHRVSSFDDARLAVPREGTVISVDDLAIPKTAREKDLAHAFINFLHEPAVAAANSNFIKYLCPNTGRYPLLGPDLRDNPAVFLSPELRAKSEILADLGAANALYVSIWDEIKAAK
jgi:hypothetical protein